MSNFSIKPTGYVEWASQTPTGIVQPTTTQKQAGWMDNTAPPAGYFNWIEGLMAARLRYLSYDWIVEDDFARGDNLTGVVTPSGGTPTGFAPTWNTQWWSSFQDALGVSGIGAAMGLAVMNITASGIASMRADCGAPWGNDYLFEAIIAVAPWVSGTGYVEVGSLNTGANGGAVWFAATGPSSLWAINWNTAAGGVTGMTLGVAAYSPTNLQTLIVEKRGATASVEINGQPQGAFQPPAMTTATIGVRATTWGPNQLEVAIDKLAFGVRRS